MITFNIIKTKAKIQTAHMKEPLAIMTAYYVDVYVI